MDSNPIDYNKWEIVQINKRNMMSPKKDAESYRYSTHNYKINYNPSQIISYNLPHNNSKIL